MWARKYSQCLNCQTMEISHKAKGLCKRCYEASVGYKWQKEYAKRYKEKHNIQQRRNIVTNGTSKKVWFKKISKRDGEFCRNCKTIENLTLQHKIPRLIGGKYSYENLEILCLKCNIADYHSLVKKALKVYFEKQKLG